MKKIIFVLMGLALSGCRFDEIDPGKLYRSPQPNPEYLEKAIKNYGLKTIVNLRGERPGANWYKDEEEVVRRNGALLINIGMSATRLPHREDLLKLLDAYRTAPKPMLIHCQAGVDRTGEAAALYQMIYMGKSRERALKSLSPKFGHFETFMPAKRYFIGEVWQNEDWAYKNYFPCKGGFKHYNVNDPVCTGGEATPLTEAEDT